jgi:hypothetical protein
MTKRTRNLLIFYVVILLLPSFLSFIVVALVANGLHYVSTGTAFCAGGVTVLGPWATLAAKSTNVPNAGEFFSLPLALGLTLGLITVISVSMAVVKRWVNTLCVVVYIPLILLWVFLGFGQLMSCIE